MLVHRLFFHSPCSVEEVTFQNVKLSLAMVTPEYLSSIARRHYCSSVHTIPFSTWSLVDTVSFLTYHYAYIGYQIDLLFPTLRKSVQLILIFFSNSSSPSSSS